MIINRKRVNRRISRRSIRVMTFLTVFVFFTLSTIQSIALALQYDISVGDVMIVNDGGGQTVNGAADDAPVVVQLTPGSSNHTITMDSKGGDTSVTIKDINIVGDKGEAGIIINGSGGAATINVEGKNSVTGGEGAAGIEVSSNKGWTDSVVLQNNNDDTIGANDVDELTVNAGKGAADKAGAGIGGKADHAAGNIEINGIDDTATPETEGLKVVATGAGDKENIGSAGIGGGSNGAGGSVTISGNAIVEATGGGAMEQDGAWLSGSNYKPYDGGGAGIGAGAGGANGGDVTIQNDATVTAQGAYNGAGIGGASTGAKGHDQSSGANVVIKDNATVTATGGYAAAGIGGGARGDGQTVDISGNATVKATGGKGGAGIGGGSGGYHGGDQSVSPQNTNGGNGGTVHIDGGRDITVVGGKGAAGIGGGAGAERARTGAGNGGAGSIVTINGGSITVTGGENAVAFGSGCNVTCNTSNLAKYLPSAAESGTTYAAADISLAGSLTINGGTGRFYAGSLLLPAVSDFNSVTWASGINVVNTAGSLMWITNAPNVFSMPALVSVPTVPTVNTMPTIPVNTVPTAPAVVVDTPAVENPVAQAVDIAENEVPLAAPVAAEQKEEQTKEIPEEEVPLAMVHSWGLLNLLCAIGSAIGAIVTLLSKKMKEDEEEEVKIRMNRLMKGYSLVMAVLSMGMFLITALPVQKMVYTDQWTLPMAILLALQLLGTAIVSRRQNAETDNDVKA